MFTAEQFRAKAAESAESLKHTDVPSKIREFQRSKQSFSMLADNEDWLAANFDKMIRSRDDLHQDEVVAKRPDRKAVAEIEEHILRCLGAAVIMQWSSNPTDTLSLLKDLSVGVGERINYQSREVEGTQSPTQTLDRGWGSCRDFAVLFAEAVRSLGFGARVVSGYLHNPAQDSVGSAGAGTTHAWTEVYVPGAGWITFDPTNRSVGGFNLIPVAVARHIRQAMPVSGSFVGMTDAFQGMEVEVSVTCPS